jgi:hypothetical protein
MGILELVEVLEHRSGDIKKIIERKATGYDSVRVRILLDASGSRFNIVIKNETHQVNETFSARLSPIAIANQVTLRWNAIQRS